MTAILTPSMAAERLHVNERTIRNMLRDGTLRGIKIGRRLWRIPETSIEALLCNTNSGSTAVNLSLSPSETESRLDASEPERMIRALRSVS